MHCKSIHLPAVEGHTRRLFSPSDTLIITHHLRQAEEEISQCEAEEKRLKAEIAELENRRRGLQKSVDFCHSLLSPLRMMPTEILSSIFMFCCEGNRLSMPFSSTQTELPVIALSMVCARWHDIVYSTPRLWSKLDVESPPLWYSQSQLLPLARTVQLFMQRSKPAPLTWSLDSFSFGIGPLLPVLVQNSERWRSINLHVNDFTLADPAFASVSRRISMLQRLELHYPCRISRQWETFAVAPALSAVACAPKFAHKLILPWVQIRDLTLRHSFSSESLFILSQCPNLERLELDCIGGEVANPEVDFQITEPITLHKVHTLTIISEEEDDFGFAFEFLTLPNLVSLIFDTYRLHRSWGWSDWSKRQKQIQQFLFRSQCIVTSLRLEIPELDDHQVLDLLRLLPSLETLYFRDRDPLPDDYYDSSQDEDEGRDGDGENSTEADNIITPLFLQHLIIKKSDPSNSLPLLPRLANLTLVIPHTEGLDAKLLCDAIISRWNPSAGTSVRSLRSVVIMVMEEGGCLEKLSPLKSLDEAAGRHVFLSHISPRALSMYLPNMKHLYSGLNY